MKTKLFLCLACLLSINFSQAQNLPANPEPGKCYVKCITKDEFKDIQETIEVYPSYTKLKVVPAKYKTVTERVLIKEASKKLVYVPAVYQTIEIPYTKKEGRTDLRVTPASFGSSSKTFEVYPKTAGWEYKETTCDSPNKEDCVVACFVEYPSRSKDVKYTTLANDAGTRNIPINQISTTYKKRIIKTPARMDEVEIPAEYGTITKQVIASPATTISSEVPAKTLNVTRTVLAKKGGITTWEEVDCGLLSANVLPIFYETGSARITPSSKKIIDETLLPLLNKKPVSIELMSHTDSRGNDNFNMSLSQQRANSVVNYLVSRGISRSRLSAKGYGETRLVNRCSNGIACSASQHQKNRRTEFRVLSN
ncbi:cell envelope biogenesis protein OmpA [Flavivirga aquatica]|uniref:Cell envelope biogenesis protein OmpA n=1 Tax=Flavivirga aquatica TaxID=1849968 RepID=A0A1E5SID9_9FLAO|nr:OmpA family protein [Flavivirga aquatica]OEJ98897.1 cell envelope biogenesis protein OmpA [Flavivirga aquatica]